ncbi:gamma carbonic anhydrase family protein [Nocardioides lijunqiniae]|uniref:gamma carbonic anhydrase family protein n=1 Tax=Nocardioides lijunqiniae TaxID=2760832 RepID=UPI001877BB4C|nr:gamma carbonic anhydrase family protein [Nocardioides lijunqiniae]
MKLYEFEGRRPRVHPEAFVAPTATLIGDVTVERGASVWFGAVLRGDICAIVVREGANVQDNSVVHATPDQTVEIGAGATVAHGCIVHGAVIGEQALLGNGSTILDGARLGAGSLVAAGSLVGPGADIPEGVLAAGTPAQVKRPLAGTDAEFWVQSNPPYYAELAQRHLAGLREIGPDDVSSDEV